MILVYLILAHLLGDFVFQPTKLVLWKRKSKLGVFVHVVIHFFTNIVVILPFIINGYIWLIYVAFILSFIHFWIDQAKINYDLKHDSKVLPFVLDQLWHFFTILMAFLVIQNKPLTLPLNKFNAVYGDVRMIIYLSFLVFISIVVEVYYYQKEREVSSDATLKINPDKVITRVLIFSLLYAFIMMLGFYVRGGVLL